MRIERPCNRRGEPIQYLFRRSPFSDDHGDIGVEEDVDRDTILIIPKIR
jgi:hypothetical protein